MKSNPTCQHSRKSLSKKIHTLKELTKEAVSIESLHQASDVASVGSRSNEIRISKNAQITEMTFFLITSEFIEVMMKMLAEAATLSEAVLADLGVILCNMFLSLDEKLDQYFHSKYFLERLFRIYPQIRNVQVLNHFSHALGMLIEFNADNFDVLDKLGCFQIYFDCLKRMDPFELDLPKTKGVIYFFQNYYTFSNNIRDLHFDFTFPLLLQLLTSDACGSDILLHSIVIELLEFLTCQCSLADVQTYFGRQSFREYLQMLVSNSFGRG